MAGTRKRRQLRCPLNLALDITVRNAVSARDEHLMDFYFFERPIKSCGKCLTFTPAGIRTPLQHTLLRSLEERQIETNTKSGKLKQSQLIFEMCHVSKMQNRTAESCQFFCSLSSAHTQTGLDQVTSLRLETPSVDADI